MKRLLRLALATLVVFAFATGPALPMPHMLGMDCHAECPECAFECCCAPAIAIHAASNVHSTSANGSAAARWVFATPWPAAVPGFPGAPPRGPPS